MTRSPVQSSTMLIHAVFSTKGQVRVISEAIEPFLYDRISKILFDICYCPALAIGGGPEHTHILFALARNWSIDAVVDTVKTRTALYLRERWLPDFEWQEIYAAVTVSRAFDEIEKDRIYRQKQIHDDLPYKDEFRKFLEDNGIEYDEEGLWD